MSSHASVPSPPPAAPAPRAIGDWVGDGARPDDSAEAMGAALRDLRRPVYVVDLDGRRGVAQSGRAELSGTVRHGYPLLAFALPLRPRDLGDPGFRADHGVAYPYMAGAMANAIASVALVRAAAAEGLLGSYGAAGGSLETIEAAVDALAGRDEPPPCCFNLIHAPSEPAHESAVVDLYLRRGVRRVEASAYIELTLPAVRYRVHGIHRGPGGAVATPNRIIAKASRVEVATRWFSPPPERLLAALVARREITAEQAALAAEVPMAQDLTAESDSGGHTDNQPAVTLLPTMLALRDRLQIRHRYRQPLRVGAAGGIGTPHAAAAAFAMGAAYIVTGSINQACVESGSSDIVRRMLAEAEQADTAMAPAADMFEMGVKLQVLKRGTMFPMRAARLYALYRAHGSLEELTAKDRAFLEGALFRAPIEEIWHNTRDYFLTRDAGLVARADANPKQKMGLVFRWYLGHSSRWANEGEDSRQIDFQIWCGPSMGAFNEWTRDSFLQAPGERTVSAVALNLLWGAAVLTRAHSLRTQGIPLDAGQVRVSPRPLAKLKEGLG